MKRSLLEIYALSVCFVAVVCLAVATGFALYDVVRFAAPKITLAGPSYVVLQSNAAFRSGYPYLLRADPAPSEEEITKMRQDTYADSLKIERRTGAQALLRMVIFILVCVVVFALHWKVAKRERESVYA